MLNCITFIIIAVNLIIMALISFDKLLKIVSTICNILLVAVKMLSPDGNVPTENDVE